MILIPVAGDIHGYEEVLLPEWFYYKSIGVRKISTSTRVGLDSPMEERAFSAVRTTPDTLYPACSRVERISLATMSSSSTISIFSMGE